MSLRTPVAGLANGFVDFWDFQERRGCPAEAAPAAPAGIPLSLFNKNITDSDKNPLGGLASG